MRSAGGKRGTDRERARVGLKQRRCAVLILCLGLPGNALAEILTFELVESQAAKQAELEISSDVAMDSVHVTGHVEADLQLADDPLDSTLQILSADLQLTDMVFDFPGSLIVTSFDFTATYSAPQVAASDSFLWFTSFDFSDAVLTFTGGTASAWPAGSLNMAGREMLPWASHPTAELSVAPGNPDELLLVLPFSFTAEISPAQLTFSGPLVASVVIPEPSPHLLLLAGLTALGLARVWGRRGAHLGTSCSVPRAGERQGRVLPARRSAV